MKRRSFLLGLLAAPAAPLLPKIAPASRHEWTVDVMKDALLEAAEKIVNPPLILSESGEILTATKVMEMNGEFWRLYAKDFTAEQINVEAVMQDILPGRWRKA